MRTVFDEKAREDLVNRIGTLNEKSTAAWGKMNVGQMLRHCNTWEEMIHQNKLYKRPFIGLLLGKFFLKKELKTETLRKNSPTIPELVITDTDIDVVFEKEKLVKQLRSYPFYQYPDYSFIHPFFGKMTKEQIGYFTYKHINHHLLQFNC